MYGQEQGQNQAKIPFSKKKELEAMVAQGKIDMAAGKITDWELAKKLQEAAMGVESSQPMEALKDIRYGQPEQAGGMPTGSGEGLTPDIGMRRATGQPGEVPFRSALRDPRFSFLNPSAPNPASGSMQVGLPSGVNPQEAQNIQNLGGGGGRPITAPGMANGEYYTGPPLPSKNAEVRMQQNVPTAGVMQGPEYMQPVMKHRQSEISKRGLLGLMGDQVGEAISPVTGALRSAGRSAGGYMKSLFDDPSRMAMLRGGLSMMDPNTYYDPQGFGSVFTGLNKGLGAAEQGHAGVLARRKSVADTFKAKAEADYAASGKGGEGQNEFRRVLAKYNDPNTSAEDKKWLGGRLEKLSQPGTDFDVKGMRNYIWETAFPSNTQLSETLDTFVNTMNSTVDTDAGIDFGPGSEFKSSVYAVLSETFGQDLGDKGQRAANTRAYMSSMGIQVGQTIKLFGAGTGLSDADLKFAKDITGQDPGSFSKASLEMLLVLNEGQMRGKLLKANKVMNSMYGGTAPEHMLQELPPMTKNLQKHISKEMKKPKGWVVKGEKVTEKPDGWNDTYEGQWDNLVAGRPDKPTTAAVSAKKQRMSGWTFTVND